jgi:hypothetical protein
MPGAMEMARVFLRPLEIKSRITLALVLACVGTDSTNEEFANL